VWRTHVEFSERVSKLWEEYQVTDNGIWVLKEKLK